MARIVNDVEAFRADRAWGALDLAWLPWSALEAGRAGRSGFHYPEQMSTVRDIETRG